MERPRSLIRILNELIDIARYSNFKTTVRTIPLLDTRVANMHMGSIRYLDDHQFKVKLEVFNYLDETDITSNYSSLLTLRVTILNYDTPIIMEQIVTSSMKTAEFIANELKSRLLDSIVNIALDATIKKMEDVKTYLCPRI